MTVKFEMTPELLSAAVELMRDTQSSCEADACALARLNMPWATELARTRLAAAKTAETLLFLFAAQ